MTTSGLPMWCSKSERKNIRFMMPVSSSTIEMERARSCLAASSTAAL